MRDTFHSSLVMAEHVLEDLGMAPEVARDRVAKFRMHDEKLLQTQYLVYDDEAALLQSAKDALADLDKLFQADSENAEDEQADGELLSAPSVEEAGS